MTAFARTGSVNLNQLAPRIESAAETVLVRRRFERFFNEFHLNGVEVVRLTVPVLWLCGRPLPSDGSHKPGVRQDRSERIRNFGCPWQGLRAAFVDHSGQGGLFEHRRAQRSDAELPDCVPDQKVASLREWPRVHQKRQDKLAAGQWRAQCPACPPRHESARRGTRAGPVLAVRGRAAVRKDAGAGGA